MNTFTLEDLKTLLECQGGPCISIYLPTHKKGGDTQQDPIKLKNLLKTAEERLMQREMRTVSAKELLAPAQDLISDTRFWSYQSDGLAIFISEGQFILHNVPLSFEELVVVSERYHTKPLLQLLTGDGRFYVLALSQNKVRLLEGTKFSVNEIELENVPLSKQEALGYDNFERQLKWRGQKPPTSAGKQAGIFHGHGEGTEESKDQILLFFRAVDKGLRDIVHCDGNPMILAGVDYLIPIYKDANTCPKLIDGWISGNPESLSAEQIHEQAWKIIEPHFALAQKQAVELYYSLAGTGKTSPHLDTVIRAAYSGRVDTLFVPVGVQRWGKVNPDDFSSEPHDEQMPGDEDLLDAAAIQTILNGGTVYAVQPDQVPDNRYIAAILRY
ncbi:hypothetical protein [Desulfomonile tiedjei]|uniref:Uncharacterized protein n=1 Tax=Desulfomonile tiedjei (strain ATCC 49306 / DSM 6799 / DCB-1) TaxID=706587 RepID=I4C701_DESTA|nr:hypothetical protein [Desulfomonile tiedjei]AFM25342.1 hypothetical protein Desti_2663 [Desulfomonile tiedjei DSM 6799]